VLTVASLLLTGWVAVRDAGPTSRGEGPGTRPAAATPAATPVSTSATPARPPGAARLRAREVLRRWDARRAEAWATGDVRGLRALYAPGAPVGRVDARMLASYVDRGLTVRGLRTQVLALRVLATAQDRLRLRVTDRVVGGEAVDGAGRVAALPVDRASERVVVLRRVAGEWRVARVRAPG
jgi:hypothetical protein